MKKILICLISLSFANLVFAEARIRIVGSSTVFPFATTVAETFGRETKFKTPVVESTGSGGGFKLFCSGVSSKTPDITNASRKIKPREIANCKSKGITPIEVKIGYDGIIVVNSVNAKPMHLTLKDLYLALAKTVPVKGKLVKNPYKYWDDINKKLPHIKIEVLGPPPTSGTRDAFVEIAMEGGAKQFPLLKKLKATNKNKFKAIAHTLRIDGAYIDSGENDNLIIQKLKRNKKVFGILGFSFLAENANAVQVVSINNIQPNFENIVSKAYPISRSLFFYVKKQSIKLKPSIKSYVAEFTKEDSWGEDGYLSEKGLIPLSESQQENIIAKLKKQGVL